MSACVINHDFRDQYARAREEQADKLAGECLAIADEVEADSAQVAKARLQVDVRKWHAGKLAPKKYGDRVEHEIKGGGVNFQPQILIQCSSAGEDEGYLELHATSEAAGGVREQGDGDSLPGTGGRR